MAEAPFVVVASTTVAPSPGAYYEIVTDGTPVRLRFLVPAGDPALLAPCILATNYTHAHPYVHTRFVDTPIVWTRARADPGPAFSRFVPLCFTGAAWLP